MSNIKRWADHDSSDDDEDHHHARGHAREAPAAEEEELNAHEEAGGQEQQEQQDHSLQDEEQQQPQQPSLRKESYDLPTEAPFTAFVGGLAFSVKDPDHLAQAITDLVYDRFQQEINVVHARVMIDKNDGKHRGFGYVELETLEMLKTVLQLDDGQSNIAGRRIQLDTATKKDNRGGSNNRLNRGTSAGSIPEVDGSKFRAGRFARKNSSEPVGGGASGTNEAAPEDFRQRPSLKLQPRSKPREGGMEDSTSSLASASNIFGGGRARDEQAWERRSSGTNAKATAGAKEGEAEEPKEGPPPPQQQQQQPQQTYQQQGDRARRSSTGRSIRGGDGHYHSGRGGDHHHTGRGDHHHTGRGDHQHTGRGDHHHTGRSGDRGGSGGRSGGRSFGERGRGGPSNRSAGGRATSANPRTVVHKKDAPAAGAAVKEEKKTAPVVKQVPANKILSPPTVQEPEKTEVKKPTNKFAILSVDSDSD